ncbi:hypothetical protein NDN08_000026 [Rhodosorus marinus]|uniref:Bystin n=1 Tax=Rhodosorus marinus TaxID=101924 RepID=A0AAV8UE22_9RHOD|nr:hypothetical protein NDN08_000026 [Rhodosorus marinus]
MEGSDEEDGREEVLDAAMTMKVLKQAKAQLVSEGSGEEEGAEVGGGKKVVFDLSSDEEEDEEEVEEEEFEEEEFDYLDETQITEEDERALAMFGMRTGQGRTIADIIQEKFEEAERKRLDAENPAPEDPTHAKVVEVYRGVGEVMKKYTTGKVPKAFKVIPNCSNWERLVWLTNPMEWSPASVFVATRLFASNLDEKQAQKFYNEVLLPRARDDIERNKKLHFSIYQAMKKALYKPKAFFKGVIFPLCEDGSCTLHEATIFGSVVAKVSVPLLHSAAALMRLSTMWYSGATSIFIRVLLDKKYALPYKVVDGLVDHFVKMESEERQLPVLWHRSLLTFAQRYKSVITREQKNRLKLLMRKQFHSGITPEIRRELFSTRSRGEAQDPDANAVAMEMTSS